jgi:cell division protein FtsI (penicillin-binding protein 3)
VAQKLGRALSVDPKALQKKLSKGSRFTWVKRRVSPAESEAVKKLELPGVGLVKESRRYYPRRELAGQVLGLVGDDGRGLEGVELAYDDALQGQEMRLPSLRDARGMQLFGEAPAPSRVLEGARVELTLDTALQHVAEAALARTVESARAASGMAIALDPQTGEILALANAPAFNPNAPRGGPEMRNRAVLDTFEPGSTVKTFSIAAALDAQAIKPTDAIDCEKGRWRIGGHVIRDHAPLGWVGPAKIMAESSNIGAAKIGQRLGKQRLHDALLAFGLGERTGLGLSGEPKGQVPFPRADISLATQSFGQGIAATPLQLTVAMAAVAGGGAVVKPWLVKRVVDPVDGTVLAAASPAVLRRAVSLPTAATITRWLEGVVHDDEATGKKARVNGYRIAGKTGTAQKADPVSGGYGDKRFASFVGFAPARDPRLVVGVFIDEPKGTVYGGEVAAPVFREVVEYAMKAWGIPPTEPLEEEKDAASQRAVARRDRSEERREVEEPAVELADDRPEPEPGSVAVPSLSGLSARAALRALEAVELVPEVLGQGRVASQVPSPGQVVERGAKVRLTLSPPG